MARSIEELLEEFCNLEQVPGYDLNMRDVWFSLLESEEQLALWAAFNESKAREARYRSACGIKG